MPPGCDILEDKWFVTEISEWWYLDVLYVGLQWAYNYTQQRVRGSGKSEVFNCVEKTES